MAVYTNHIAGGFEPEPLVIIRRREEQKVTEADVH